MIKASSVEKDVLCNARAAAEDRIETVMARQTGFEQEMTESHGSLEEASKLREIWACGNWRVCQKRQTDSGNYINTWLRSTRGHEDELESLTTNPHAELPMDTDTAWKRETGATSLL